MKESGDTQDMLIFVYNTDSGTFRNEADASGTVVSPPARECALYALTCGVDGMKREWEDYLGGLNHRSEVLRRDEMETRYPAVGVRLPAVLKDSGSDLTLVLDAGEIRACRDLDELMDLLTYKLEHTGVLMHGL
jgi:hypothetical protein